MNQLEIPDIKAKITVTGKRFFYGVDVDQLIVAVSVDNRITYIYRRG